MCLICVDFQRQRLTLPEARRALMEMAQTLDPGHQDEVREMLDRAEEEGVEGRDD
jgi:hypothetical protein